MVKNKKNIILIIAFYLINFLFNAHSENLIIPKKKPQISNETKVLSELKSEILPLKKPLQSKNEVIQSQKSEKKKQFTDILIPKSKPLIVTKKIENKSKTYKSKFYNKKDLEIARKSIQLIEKKKWKTAITTSKKAKDKSIYNFIVWRYLLERTNNADFSLYNEFLERNKSYPRIGRIEYLSEKKIVNQKY